MGGLGDRAALARISHLELIQRGRLPHGSTTPDLLLLNIFAVRADIQEW
jgi:hypothetical protein